MNGYLIHFHLVIDAISTKHSVCTGGHRGRFCLVSVPCDQ